MSQDTLYEGIFRGLKANRRIALLIICLAVLLTTLLHRVFPTMYQSHILMRVLTTEGITGESLASSMQGVLSQCPHVAQLMTEHQTVAGAESGRPGYSLEDAGPGLVKLHVRHFEATHLKSLGEDLVKILSEQFLDYSSESDHFEMEALEMRRRAILEKMLTIRKEKDEGGLLMTLKSMVGSRTADGEVIELERELEMLRERLALTPKVRVVASHEQSPESVRAKKRLSSARAELAELLISYREKHPKVKKATTEIARLEREVKSFSAKRDLKEENPEYLSILRDITEKEIRLGDLKQGPEGNADLRYVSSQIFNGDLSGVEQRLIALKNLYDQTVLRLEQVEMKKATARGKIQVLTKNENAPDRVGLSLVQREVLGLFGGALFAVILLYSPKQIQVTPEQFALSNASLLGYGAAWGDPDAVQRMMRVPLLTHSRPGLPGPSGVPAEYDERLIVLNEPDSRILEPMKALLANLQIQLAETGARVLMVCSSRAGMGRTALAANLGVLFAQEGYSIVLVDANFRKPSLHKVFERDNHRGLSTLLQGQKTEETIQSTWIPNLSVIPSGPIPPNSLELLSSAAMKQLLDSLRRRFEIVLIDNPGLLDYPDARIIGSHVNGVVALSREGESPEDSRACREFLKSLKTRVLGFVQT
jgi:protein-tyrosine kinase